MILYLLSFFYINGLDSSKSFFFFCALPSFPPALLPIGRPHSRLAKTTSTMFAFLSFIASSSWHIRTTTEYFSFPIKWLREEAKRGCNKKKTKIEFDLAVWNIHKLKLEYERNCWNARNSFFFILYRLSYFGYIIYSSMKSIKREKEKMLAIEETNLFFSVKILKNKYLYFTYFKY